MVLLPPGIFGNGSSPPPHLLPYFQRGAHTVILSVIAVSSHELRQVIAQLSLLSVCSIVYVRDQSISQLCRLEANEWTRNDSSVIV